MAKRASVLATSARRLVSSAGKPMRGMPEEAPQRPEGQRDHDRVLDEVPADRAEDRDRIDLRRADAVLPLGAHHQERDDGHHDRQLDRDDQRHRNRAVGAKGGERQRDPDQGGVAVAGGEPGDEPGAGVATEETADDEGARRPAEGKTREEGEPEAPRRNSGKVRRRQDAEDEERYGDDEHELGQGLGGVGAEELRPGDAIADADQAEDGEDDGNEVIHTNRASGGDAR